MITGCRGQLGRELSRQIAPLLAAGEVTGLLETDLHNLDITEMAQVRAFIQRGRPDLVINCAAYTDVDGCEAHEERAFMVNALGARNLAAAAFAVGAGILQVSTDYVFDGTSGRPMREYDAVNPLNVYGRSKAWGEELVRSVNPRHFIVRTAWLYGEGANFVRTMLRLAEEREEIAVVDDQVGTPTSAVDLARCILDLIRTDYYGTYHATSAGQCSRYRFALKIFELEGIAVRIRPITSEELDRPAKRPRYSVLDNFLLRLAGLDRFRPWEAALAEYLDAPAGGGGPGQV